MPHQGRELMGLRSRSQKVFDAGDQVLDAATKGYKEAATTLLYQAFEPALLELKQDLDAFRNRSHGEFSAFMNEQNLATEKPCGALQRLWLRRWRGFWCCRPMWR